MIDLHTHSTASDGSWTPGRLVMTAADIGLSALALTDHDTVDGLDEAIQAARATELTFVPGIEISTASDRGALHILGLFIRHRDEGLAQLLEELIALRNERNAAIAEALTAAGLPISLEEVVRTAGGRVVGRPHFAQLMTDKGYVKRFKTAFSRYLDRDKPAYVPRQKPSPQRTIAAIRNCGGVPVLAHPDQTLKRGSELANLVRQLTDDGLAGIEVYCSKYPIGQTHAYIRLAQKFNLVLSGGSDFHGAAKSKLALGRGTGRLRVPDELLQPLIDRAEQIRTENR